MRYDDPAQYGEMKDAQVPDIDFNIDPDDKPLIIGETVEPKSDTEMFAGTHINHAAIRRLTHSINDETTRKICAALDTGCTDPLFEFWCGIFVQTPVDEVQQAAFAATVTMADELNYVISESGFAYSQ